ncbi:DUF6249 domain-containing protein [Hyphobacterium sp. HN65]|uniref:DUF6249 domain-containing protein n=1 Tax=Hyphobacterium lacteum TaxID=3116575 RepID=A0ABU7LLF4_9PROT|nr:DUF6249 domain-containing protein [Hyphobacterium sp. HN65]MEE2524749.1 DUF6249 domain-containing protein [Hyphobacterium sp. HN65]
MGPDVLAPLTVFGSVVLIVWIVYHHGSKNRREVLETVRQAAQSGTQLTPDVIRALGMPQKKKGGDIRAGIILLAVAAAFLALGLAISGAESDPEVIWIMAGVAAFPGFVGAALVLMGVLFRDKSENA